MLKQVNVKHVSVLLAQSPPHGSNISSIFDMSLVLRTFSRNTHSICPVLGHQSSEKGGFLNGLLKDAQNRGNIKYVDFCGSWALSPHRSNICNIIRITTLKVSLVEVLSQELTYYLLRGTRFTDLGHAKCFFLTLHKLWPYWMLLLHCGVFSYWSQSGQWLMLVSAPSGYACM